MNLNEEAVCIVTGASRGLGFAVAEQIGQTGAHVIAVARTVGGLEELADKIDAIGGTTTLVPLDITDEAGIQNLGKAIHDRWGRLDLWVHCAAAAAPLSPVAQLPEKDFDKVMAVNARATQRLITMFDPLLKASEQGTALFISDTQAGEKFQGSYGASKAAMQAIVDSYAAETRQIGPRVISFAPNPMPTALRARFYPGEDRSALTPCADEARRLMAAVG